jgi:UDP-glucose 4-epimerase
MNVFVTGGAGYIGSVCVEELLNAGHTVTVFDSLVEGHRSAVDPRATFVRGDLMNRQQTLEALKASGAEGIIHFAAFALVGESMTNPAKYFSNNVVGGLHLLDAAVALGIRKFVFSSTCATYGPPERVPMTEDLPQRPINPYGESKLMVEQMLRWYRDIHRLEFVAFRYFNAAGASVKFGEHHRIETHLIPNVLKVALGQKTHVEIFGTDYPTPDGTCIRDYIHVSDLASAHVTAMQELLAGGPSFIRNLGTGTGFSVRSVIETVSAVSGLPVPHTLHDRRPGDPAALAAQVDPAAQQSLRFPNLPDIVRTTWESRRRKKQKPES